MPEARDNQIRRTARILEMIQQIASAPRYWTRRKLAKVYEISERMIQKDLELVRIKLGLDLRNEREGYYFNRLPHLPTMNFSFAEAVALLSAARAGQAVPGTNSVELAAAIARLECIFPDALRPLLKTSLDQLPRSAQKSHRQSMLTLFYRALSERRCIRMDYQSNRSKESKSRLVAPYSIYPYGRSWHVVAYDHLREDVLQFKLDRVHLAELTEKAYIMPADFNLEDYLGDGWGLMRGAASEPEKVRLLFDETAGRWVSEEVWHKSQEINQLADGTFEMQLYVGVTPEMVNWLLYYGAHVRVEEPLWLREKVREEHRRASTLEEISIR